MYHLVDIKGHKITQEDMYTAESNGIALKNVYDRVVSKGWSIDRAINTPLRKVSQEYLYHKNIALKNLISVSTFRTRVNVLKWRLEKASSTPVLDKRDNLYYVNGIEKQRKYNRKYLDTAKQNNINKNTFYWRILYLGWTLEEACTIPPGTKNAGRKKIIKDNKLIFMRRNNAH